jgi:small-conductance mechanosensitive channel
MLSQSEAEPAGLEAVLREFVNGILSAVPKVALGVLFLAIAYVVIKVVVAVVRSFLERVYPSSQRLVVDLWVALVAVFLWFGAALALLNVVGLGDVAASLGTASGFVGLGVAFALKEMIADTVAGVYLLRDPDFNEGDVVESASVTGEIVSIDLRKTRLRAEDGDLVVVANRDVEKKWRQDAVGPESAKSEHATSD